MLFKKKKEDNAFDSDLGSPFDIDNKKSNENNDLFSNMDTNKAHEDNPSMDNFSSGIDKGMDSSLEELHSKGFSQQSNISTNMNNTSSMDSKDFQIINSKLDSIKSELDALSQHVLKIERDISSDETSKNKKKPMW